MWSHRFLKLLNSLRDINTHKNLVLCTTKEKCQNFPANKGHGVSVVL